MMGSSILTSKAVITGIGHNKRFGIYKIMVGTNNEEQAEHHLLKNGLQAAIYK